jgi:hypothetical protein
MLAAREHLEELAILARRRIEGPHGLARASALALRDPIQLPKRRRRVVAALDRRFEGVRTGLVHPVSCVAPGELRGL